MLLPYYLIYATINTNCQEIVRLLLDHEADQSILNSEGESVHTMDGVSDEMKSILNSR